MFSDPKQVQEQEDFLRRDPLKQQALAVMGQISKLEKEKEQLEQDTAHLRLSFPEQKKLLRPDCGHDARGEEVQEAHCTMREYAGGGMRC